MTRTLYLHVGHEKTGSSYVQTSLARSSSELRALGIAYAWHPENRAAQSGMISSGNGDLILARNPPPLPASMHSVLFSGEMMFHHLRDREVLAIVRRHLSRWSIQRVKVLLFTRNPVEHAISMHQQDIKRRGSTANLESFFDSYAFPEDVATFLRMTTHSLGATVSVRNYSKRKRDLLTQVESWLEVHHNTLRRPTTLTVNRSLTLAELQMQMRINEILGSEARFVADALCNELPSIMPERHSPDPSVQRRLLARLEPAMAWVDAQCDPHDFYGRDLLPFSPDPFSSLTSEQIDVATRALARALSDCRATMPARLRSQIDRFARMVSRKSQAKAMFKDYDRG